MLTEVVAELPQLVAVLSKVLLLVPGAGARGGGTGAGRSFRAAPRRAAMPRRPRSHRRPRPAAAPRAQPL